MKNPLTGPEKLICRCLKKIMPKDTELRRRAQMQQLFPLEDSSIHADKYQSKKIRLVIVIFFIGIVTVISYILCSRNENKMTEGAYLFRNEKGAGDYPVTLTATAGDWKKEITITVHERQLRTEERKQLFQEVQDRLPELIKGNNQSLQHVTSKLNLIHSIPEYPFSIVWSSSNYRRITTDGSINRENLVEQGETVELTAVICDENEKYTATYQVCLQPKTLSEEESFFTDLQDEITRADKLGQSSPILTLPKELDEKEIEWEENHVMNYLGFLGFLLFGIGLVCRGMEQELQKAQEKRKKQLLQDYPECVNRFRLYLSAGLTVKKAFLRITGDYIDGNPEIRQYLYEEMQVACNQLKNGVMEEIVYREWGLRCGEMKLKQLSYLFSVHIKKGNAQLLEILEQETQTAQEDRRKLAQKWGEEAGIRLLFPMMLMLLIVMFLILLPVWLDFGSI